MDLDYSPTGREFVSASYDCTVRIFERGSGRSREVYHTRRMQRIFCVRWTADAKYIVCGSDEFSLRLWKAQASEHLGAASARQRAATRQAAKLQHKFRHHPEVRRISRHRHVPKNIYRARQEKHAMLSSRKRKQRNRAVADNGHEPSKKPARARVVEDETE